MSTALAILPEVGDALARGHPVVALESSLLTHGLPRPTNLETARSAEAAVREAGAVPATIAVLDGQLKIGLTATELERLATLAGVMKASRRDLAAVISQNQSAGTTVAATMFLAHRAGLHVFATGGIGGVHRGLSPLSPVGRGGGGEGFDISADLPELARTPVCVVCAGAKSILDIPRTLEFLETHGVPVVGYGVGEFPAFYVQSSGVTIDTRVDSPGEAARLLHTHWELGGAGVVLAQPVPASAALHPAEFDAALQHAEHDAEKHRVRGKELTPFLLRKLAEMTNGKTLIANQALVVENARLAAKVAKAFLQP
jgi:pseudouridine-5'-phosphate glycosidase